VGDEKALLEISLRVASKAWAIALPLVAHMNGLKDDYVQMA
jgi:hypothetical protein